MHNLFAILPEYNGIGLLGWIIVGFLAGALSGVVVRNRTAGGCLANILIGILGGILGGLLARQFFDTSEVAGWVGAFIVAFVGAVIVRWLLGLVNGPRRP
ncbi:MAG: GlsB/YeaQ/YmgE family stress response membrane protein [Chloroflexota bacterium]